jgi:hypothetical protein
VGDVFGALAESGNVNGKNVKAVKEIAAKGALGDDPREIAIRGGDDPYVDALRAIASEAFELLLLQHAKQFGLQIERQVGDFIEE